MAGKVRLEERLVSAALIGTGKQTPAPLESAHPVDQLLASQTSRSPEQQLLLQAGARGVYLLAGTCSQSVPALPAAPPEEGIPASERIGELLQAAFSPQALPLLEEFLELLQTHGIQLPSRLLPLALNMQDRSRRLRLREVLGARARWLAALHSEWAWLIQEAETSGDPASWKRSFDEGTLAERVTALQQFRQHDPAATRELLEGAIADEKGEAKRKLLECLNVGLTVDDETFLERFQTDRAKKVRELVCEMLGSLPDSQLTQRNSARLAACFQNPQSPSNPEQWKIVLPPEVPEDWKRDGLGESTRQGISPRSALLRELIGRTPLSFWTNRFQKTPEELLSLIERHEEGEDLRSGWADALQTFGTHDAQRDGWEASLWAAAVRQRRLGRSELPELIQNLQRLAEVISPQQLDGLLARLIHEFPDVTQLPMENWVSCVSVPWSVNLSKAWLQATREVFRKQGDVGMAEWSATLLKAALGIAPACFEEALQPWSLNSSSSAAWVASQLEALLRQFGEVIRIRQEFHQEIQRSIAEFRSASHDGQGEI